MKRILSIIAGSMLALALVAGGASVYAQTGTGGTGTGGTGTGGTTGTGGFTTQGTVGAPNTGAGGDAMMNIAILVSTGAIAAGGAAFLLRDRRITE